MPTIQELVTDISHPGQPLDTVPEPHKTPFYFDSSIPRYRTCCCMHLTTCSYIIGVFEILIMLFFLLDAILIWLKAGSAHSLQLGFCVAGVIFALVAVILMFLSMSCDKPQLMIPHIVMQAIVLILLLIMTVLCIVALVAGTSVLVRIINRSDTLESALHDGLSIDADADVSQVGIVSSYMQITVIFFMLLFLLLAFFEIWAISIVLRTFQYLKMKNRYRKVERNGRVMHMDVIGPLQQDPMKRN